MSRASLAVLESGCDYITVTSKSTNPKNQLAQTAATLVSLERLSGNVMRDWRALGYEGVACGSASYGVGVQGTIARLSSGFARDYYQELLPHAENCSRFDLQTTIRLPSDCSKWIAKQFKSMCEFENQHKRPRSVKVIVSRTGCETLMVGSRSSDRYGRIYDKAAESGLPFYASCVRLEVEFKNNFAVANASECARQRSEPAWVNVQVMRWFSKRGGTLPTIPNGALVHCTPRNIKDDSDILLTVSRCIRPFLIRAVRRAGPDPVLKALDLDDYLVFNRS